MDCLEGNVEHKKATLIFSQAVFEFGPKAFTDGGLGYMMRTSPDVLCKPHEVAGMLKYSVQLSQKTRKV